MNNTRLFLILLLSFFAAPLALADEIGGGSPDESQSSATQTTSVSEGSEATCWIEEFLSWFE